MVKFDMRLPVIGHVFQHIHQVHQNALHECVKVRCRLKDALKDSYSYFDRPVSGLLAGLCPVRPEPCLGLLLTIQSSLRLRQ